VKRKTARIGVLEHELEQHLDSNHRHRKRGDCTVDPCRRWDSRQARPDQERHSGEDQRVIAEVADVGGRGEGLGAGPDDHGAPIDVGERPEQQRRSDQPPCAPLFADQREARETERRRAYHERVGEPVVEEAVRPAEAEQRMSREQRQACREPELGCR
jgi:hypothetical protein